MQRHSKGISRNDKAAKRALSMLFQGDSYQKIGDAFGITRQSAWEYLHKDELKEKFENYLKKYLAMTLPRSLTDSAALVNSEPEDMDMMRLKYAEIDKVLKTAGMRPSENTPIFIQNLNQINTFENPMIKQVLKDHAKTLLDWSPEGVTDAEEVS